MRQTKTFEYENIQYKIIYDSEIGFIYGFPGYYIEFRTDNKSIGNAVLSVEMPKFKDINHNYVSVDTKQNDLYLVGIKVKDKYIGKRLGRIFLNMLFDNFDIDKLWLYSIKHPHWDKIATKKYLYVNGGDVYTLTKEQITL